MTPLLAIENGGYVGAAYTAFLLLLLIYVVIMAAKLQRIQREIASLAELAERPAPRAGGARDASEIREREIESAGEAARR
jgi:type II secretory pathway component PulM